MLEGPTAVVKRFLGLLWRLVLLPFRVLKWVLGLGSSVRGTSPATKALTLLAIVLGAVTGAGLLFATQANMEVSASSAPIISAVLEWMTNGWGYVLAAIIFGRGSIWGLRKARISKAAKETGYLPTTIAHCADEIRATDGTTRAIIFGTDTVAQATERILETFDGTDDAISYDAKTDPDDRVDPLDVEMIEARLAEAAQRAAQLQAEIGGDLPSDSGPNRAERFKLWRMDLATALRTDDIVWKFGVPTAIVFVLELILVRFWVQWWLYPSLLAGAALVGLGVYKGDQYRRKRRLQRHRSERRGETWEEIGVLVKTVESADTTVHMGFLAGRSYASKSREELAETLAERALERSHGYHPSPAIEERNAWLVDRYILNFAGWRENIEKPAIMDELVDTVLESKEGLLPKNILATRVIEHDRRYIWQGLRFVGMGYDPDLVAECYDDLVPSTLVEHDLEIDAPDGQREVIAVRARTESLPPDVAKLRANFSDRFPVRELREDRYSLPTVEPDDKSRGFVLPRADS